LLKVLEMNQLEKLLEYRILIPNLFTQLNSIKDNLLKDLEMNQ